MTTLSFKCQGKQREAWCVNYLGELIKIASSEGLNPSCLVGTCHCILLPVLSVIFLPCLAPCGAGAPLSSPLSIYFLIFSPFYFFLYFVGFTYFLLLSIPSLSTRIVPLRFQAGGRRRRPNLGLVCFFV